MIFFYDSIVSQFPEETWAQRKTNQMKECFHALDKNPRCIALFLKKTIFASRNIGVIKCFL